MYSRKVLPKDPLKWTQDSNENYSRANDIRRDEDSLREFSIGLYDVDQTIKWYFDNIIKPEVNEFGTKVPVPVMYGSPERWKNVQVDGYFRDKVGKILTPLIAYRRTSLTKNRTLGTKIDANRPALYYTEEVKYTQQNRYDQFSVLTNSKPIKTFVNVVMPEYIDVTYDILIWTDFVEHMNAIVESIIYTEGSFWGEPDKFKFRTKIDSFTNTTDLLADNDRTIRTSMQLTMFGYLIPDVLSKQLSNKLATQTYDVRQIALKVDTDEQMPVIHTSPEPINTPVFLQGPVTGSLP